MEHDVYLPGATYSGTFRGRKWFIHVHPRLGHPCAYVQVLPDDVWGKEATLDSSWNYNYVYFDIDVHNGASYFGQLPIRWTNASESEKDLAYVGWSYDGTDDYDLLFYDDENARKWTYEDILMEIGIVVSNIENANLEVMK